MIHDIIIGTGSALSQLKGLNDLEIKVTNLEFSYQTFSAVFFGQGNRLRIFHTCHISHCEIKSHRIWPIWKAIPITRGPRATARSPE